MPRSPPMSVFSACLLTAQEDKEGKKIYHLWLQEGLAVALFEQLQKQGRFLRNDKLENYVMYIK